MKRRDVLATLGAGLAGALAGCGGGSDGRASPPAPATESGWVYTHAWDYVETEPLVTAGGDDPRLFVWGNEPDEGTTVAALDAEREEQWTADLSIPVGGLFPDADGVTVAYDTATDDYAEGSVPRLGRLSADGEVLWTKTLTIFDGAPQAVFRTAGETILVGHAGGPTVAVDRDTGDRLWTAPDGEFTGRDKTTVLTTTRRERDGEPTQYLVARDPQTGRSRWDRQFDVRDVTLGRDRVYVLTVIDDRRTLHTVDKATGQRRWRVDLGSNSYVGNGVGAGLHAVDEGVLFAGKPLAAYTPQGEELARIPEEEIPAVEVNVDINHVFLGADRVVLEAGNAGYPEHLIGLSREDYTIAWDRPSPMSWAFGRVGMLGNTLYLVSGRRPASGDDDFVDRDERAESEVVAIDGDRGGDAIDRTWIPGTPDELAGDTMYALVSRTTETQGGIYGYPEWHG